MAVLTQVFQTSQSSSVKKNKLYKAKSLLRLSPSVQQLKSRSVVFIFKMRNPGLWYKPAVRTTQEA